MKYNKGTKGNKDSIKKDNKEIFAYFNMIQKFSCYY